MWERRREKRGVFGKRGAKGDGRREKHLKKTGDRWEREKEEERREK
jgi:hypothetical protein